MSPENKKRLVWWWVGASLASAVLSGNLPVEYTSTAYKLGTLMGIVLSGVLFGSAGFFAWHGFRWDPPIDTTCPRCGSKMKGNVCDDCETNNTERPSS